MKKLLELKADRTALIKSLEERLDAADKLTPELRTEVKADEVKLEDFNKDIEIMEKAEERAKLIIVTDPTVSKKVEKKEEVPCMGTALRSAIKDAVDNNTKAIFKLSDYAIESRASTILTSTETGIINKTVAPNVDIITSPAEAFLRLLGTTFYSGLTGNFIVPSMAQDTATFPGEDTSALTADMDPEALTLTSRRITHWQEITYETLLQTNPGIYSAIIQNLYNGVWNRLTIDYFTQLESDCAAREYQRAYTILNIDFRDLVNMESTIGGLIIS